MSAPKVPNSTKDSTPQPQAPVISSISSKGLESHKVETEDGYVLGLFRFVGGGNKEGENGQEKVGESPPQKHKIPVLFVAGLFNDGLEWLLLDEEKTLPNMLAKQGYDCWLGSLRGTPHSREHTSLKTSSKKFWDFCLDEQSKYDLPSLIDYILKVTQQKDLFYIGLSMGGYIPLSMLCLRPEYGPKVRAIVALAPGVYFINGKHPLVRLSIPLGARLSYWRFLYRRRVGTNVGLLGVVKKCVPSCTNINREKLAGRLLKLSGRLSGAVVQGCRVDQDALELVAAHMPASTSLKHMAHIAQIFHAKELRMFDYGRNRNIKLYGTPKPPLLDLSQVSVPVATFTSEHDRLIPCDGVLRVSEELPNLISHTNISTPKWAHCDFIIGSDVHVLLFPQVVDILNRYSTNTGTPPPCLNRVDDINSKMDANNVV